MATKWASRCMQMGYPTCEAIPYIQLIKMWSFQKDLIEGQILRYVVATCGQFRHIFDNRLSRVLVWLLN